jgi:hypothetical protein
MRFFVIVVLRHISGSFPLHHHHLLLLWFAFVLSSSGGSGLRGRFIESCKLREELRILEVRLADLHVNIIRVIPQHF